MTVEIRQLINSIPDKRIAVALAGIIDRRFPSGKNTAITATASGVQATAITLNPAVSFHEVTVVATVADAVALPKARVGEYHVVRNSAALAMQVFAPTPDTIDSVATATGVSQLGGTSVLYYCVVPGNYVRLGGVSATPAAKFTTGTTTTTFAAGQLTGADNVVYENSQATPGSIATRTATQMFGDYAHAKVGGSYTLRINNNQGTGTLTVTAGTGVTLTGTMTIAINTYRDFIVTFTSATTLTIQQVGIGTGA